MRIKSHISVEGIISSHTRRESNRSFKMFAKVNKMFVFVVLLCCLVNHSLGMPTEIVEFNDVFTSPYEEIEVDEQIYEAAESCKVKKHHIDPNDLVRQDGENWKFDENLTQSIVVELCENEGESCTDHPLMKSKCTQKYLEIQLKVVSSNGTESRTRPYTIPSNCVCSLYQSPPKS